MSRSRFLLCAAVVALASVSACSSDDATEGTTSGAGGGASSSTSAEATGATATGSTPATSSSATTSATTSTGAGGAEPIWQAPVGTSWQWQLTGAIDTSVDAAMFDVDLFDAPDAALASLKSSGKVVICYFSAGSREDWRDDAGQFAASDYGNPLDGWPGETWLDVRSGNVRDIMRARLDRAEQRGCDGVEPDNVDGYANATGFPLSEADQLDYNTFLAAEAHARGLSVGLKNAVELVAALEAQFDWALNEECLSYDECDALSPFLDAGKAVFHVEYVDDPSQGPAKQAEVCGEPSIEGFSTLIKTWDLDAFRVVCP